MSVNERLVAAGLLEPFTAAARRRDADAISGILAMIGVAEDAIAKIAPHAAGPAWIVIVEVCRRFPEGDWAQAGTLLREVVLPLLDRPDRDVDRARVKLALVKLAGGDLAALRQWSKQAETDWRDVLVAAGMAHGDWRQTLAREGFLLPGAENWYL